MRRASAVAYLFKRRRQWLEKMEATPEGNIESELNEIELIERLILDVRAGRVHAFQFADRQAVEIYVSED